MPKLIMTKGLPASGKTSWAKWMLGNYPGQYKRVNKDDLRAMVDDGQWSKKNEKLILVVRDALVSTFLGAGYSVIVDDTNLAPKHEEQLRELAGARGLKFEIKDFTDVTPEECIERDQKRPNYVGEKVIWSMYNSFLKQKTDVAKYVPPVYDPELPDCILVDIDGTLAHMTDRSPYDYTRVHEDVIDPIVRSLVNRYAADDIMDDNRLMVILMSGRKDSCRDATIQWLKDNYIRFDLLYMRSSVDNRKDYIVKQELYEANVKGKYNVLFVLDDRQQVVDMWRNIGLKCLQVAEGNF